MTALVSVGTCPAFALRLELLFSHVGVPCDGVAWPPSHSVGHSYPSLSLAFPVLLSPGLPLTQRVTATLLSHWRSPSYCHLASLSLRGSQLPFSLTGVPCLTVTWPPSHSEGHSYPSLSLTFPVLARHIWVLC